MRITLALLVVAVVSSTYSSHLPNIPSGRRSQYYVLNTDGGYRYGYDTNRDYSATQSGSAQNEVSGQYMYRDINGRPVDIRYTAGVRGFIPEGLQRLHPQPSGSYAPVQAYSYPAPSIYSSSSSSEDDQANTGDSSYSFSINTDTYQRQESSDASGNVQGRYSYTNEAGNHDLSYIAGSQTGFVATSGSLAQPNGVQGQAASSGYASGRALPVSSGSSDNSVNTDGSYSFGYSTNDQSRQESSDASGNVKGRYCFSNEAGTHDLSYVAGSATGFQPTGGSLSEPNGLAGSAVSAYSAPHTPNSVHFALPSADNANSDVNSDGSYSFSYSTNDQSRQESSDASGNVQGRYSFSNEAGTHDLSYVAGSATGFQPTRGSLSAPNGLAGSTVSAYSAPRTPVSVYSALPSQPSAADNANINVNSDGSYSFSYSTNDQSRQESSDASGNVQGRYSFSNEAGTHDLSYVAGSATGFQPTGGSLSVPNVLAGISAPATTYSASQSSETAGNVDSTSNADGSYAFSFSTNDQSRQESSDASGNVQGRYSYTNAAGSHDLSYIAGSQTGFVPTGGNLATPNGLEGSSVSAVPTTYSSESEENNDDQANTGDASYSFTVDTPDYQRQETSDAQGNVRGSFSYRNMAGQHDLSFVAGSQTGFQPTSGSLALPNGLEGRNLPSPSSISAPAVAPGHVTSYSSNSVESEDSQANTGDASYSFTVDTPEYQRQESSDAQGNVRGHYSYRNRAGSHDLSYVAGSSTGFVAAGGSLATANGLAGSQVSVPEVTPITAPVAAVRFLPPQARPSVIHSENSVASVRTYLPSESHSRYGYVYEA